MPAPIICPDCNQRIRTNVCGCDPDELATWPDDVDRIEDRIARHELALGTEAYDHVYGSAG